MARKASITKQVEDFIQSSAPEKESARTSKKLLPQNMISTGSTLLNLAATNSIHGGLLKGRYYVVIGSSGGGKTWLCYTVLAESTLHKRFKNYRIIYDNPEKGADFDVARYFGKKTEQRIEQAWPGRKDENGNPIPDSRTVEEFYDNVENKLDEVEKDGNGMIYIEDSMDCLTTNQFLEYNQKNKEARAEGKEESGSYGDGKAKINSQRLRDVVNRLDRSGSILIIVCQERDVLNSKIPSKTFSGGNAILFYACMQFWLKKIGHIDVTINGKKRNLGTETKCQILKNRLTGQQDRDVSICYYHNFGIDDIGDIINFLLEEKHWTGGDKSTSKIKAVDFGVELTKEALIEYIQADIEREHTLRRICGEVWNEIQDEIARRTKRISRYE